MIKKRIFLGVSIISVLAAMLFIPTFLIKVSTGDITASCYISFWDLLVANSRVINGIEFNFYLGAAKIIFTLLIAIIGTVFILSKKHFELGVLIYIITGIVIFVLEIISSVNSELFAIHGSTIHSIRSAYSIFIFALFIIIGVTSYIFHKKDIKAKVD